MDTTKILEFVAAGFRLDQCKPANGSKIKVITTHLNVFTARYESFLGNNYFETTCNFRFKKGEDVYAWKYLTKK
jgi:hypothetical protein